MPAPPPFFQPDAAKTECARFRLLKTRFLRQLRRMERVDTIVIGAGVIGIAIARALAQKGREVLILEAEAAPGSVTSARNSGVIHAGIYYKPGSLKARLCVQGRDKLYAYAAERSIPFARCGKLIVAATDDQIGKLQEWKATAEKNGVKNLRLLSAKEAKAMEPEVACVAALHSPDTGIIDQHNYIHSLLGDAEAAGATLALRAKVDGGEVADNGFVLNVGGDAPTQIACRVLINAAGLGAQDFAHNLRGLDPATIPPLVLAKGNYFSLSGAAPFKMLIYPLPVLGSSGLHASCDLSGRVHFGPDVEWVERIDYRVDPARVQSFADAVRRYYPNLRKDALAPDYSGIRPKLARASPHDSDFVIQTAVEHKIPNLVNLYGIESPGLTSSLALAEEVAGRLV
jgi:L-2-hydroxyglutarate oxidase LhgO